ncbi:5-formyltetrahydrofolate cyclo-ligase [Alicyclobacillus ferrooxydans]|uniref:5-formyltetrahydrofolate cyclo-ligase n=1 Tax=Alicyclobacillus ferrooxydans TaxID=471514 RepID=UPI0006D58618|nr:5-formyltetrahydrofolate cyclo-ligase [Alicyclobacillus ferrooxydans]
MSTQQSTEKKQLRRHYIRVRGQLSEAMRKTKDEQLCAGLMPFLSDIAKGLANGHGNDTHGTMTVALYRPMGSEVSVWEMAEAFATLGWRTVVPVTDTEVRQLRFAAVTRETIWRSGALGIIEPDLTDRGTSLVEPAEVSVFCVPGLAFTEDGWRLGYGGGYYDRLFSHPGVTARRIGVAYECQLASTLPGESHDIRMHALATENGVRECKGVELQ